MQFVQQKNPTDGDLLSSLKKIEDRQYQNVSDVAKVRWPSLLTKNEI